MFNPSPKKTREMLSAEEVRKKIHDDDRIIHFALPRMKLLWARIISCAKELEGFTSSMYILNGNLILQKQFWTTGVNIDTGKIFKEVKPYDHGEISFHPKLGEYIIPYKRQLDLINFSIQGIQKYFHLKCGDWISKKTCASTRHIYVPLAHMRIARIDTENWKLEEDFYLLMPPCNEILKICVDREEKHLLVHANIDKKSTSQVQWVDLFIRQVVKILDLTACYADLYNMFDLSPNTIVMANRDKVGYFTGTSENFTKRHPFQLLYRDRDTEILYGFGKYCNIDIVLAMVTQEALDLFQKTLQKLFTDYLPVSDLVNIVGEYAI